MPIRQVIAEAIDCLAFHLAGAIAHLIHRTKGAR